VVVRGAGRQGPATPVDGGEGARRRHALVSRATLNTGRPSGLLLIENEEGRAYTFVVYSYEPENHPQKLRRVDAVESWQSRHVPRALEAARSASSR